ncbi:MAG: hypothetical protein ACXABK_03355 [Candidatus Heimdallarchaeaceae archaeon]|jgi:predicted transcriptional regulator
MKKISNKYKESNAYFSLEGSGDPWSYFTSTRKNILRALHNRLPLEEIADIFNISLDDLMTYIKPLVESSLLQKVENDFITTLRGL